ncbi:MAG TPA: hypothetical protein VFQ72_01020 [Candidatus Paceibacterota bacterium]|nr:hypothetical protein [Candidatus Paceibacterota bacterium]
MKETDRKSYIIGITASIALLGVYFGVVSLVSGTAFASKQFGLYWPFLLTLALGFGAQVGLYLYFKGLASNLCRKVSSKTIAVTGTTSTLSMISCCAHYLVNVLPILGATGALAFIGAYQVEFFWVGILANIAGLAFIIRKIILIKNYEE